MPDKLLERAIVSGLARTVFAVRYDNPKPTPPFHEEVWSLCCSDYKYVAIAAPRGHAKTSSITGSYLMSALLSREHKFVVVLSDTETQASDFLTEIRNEFMDNPQIRSMFGFEKFAKDATTDMIVQFNDGAQARVVAKGSEQKVRGLKWFGSRPDLVIGDDLENEELVSSEARRAKFRKWFYGSVLPMGSDTCVYRIAGTILHFDSLLESLMPDPAKDNVKRIGLMEYKIPPKHDRGWASAKFRAHSDDFSEILWPEKFSRDRLEGIRMDYIRQGLPEVYSQEYLNLPISDDNAYFREEDFKPIPEGAEVENPRWYVAADLAITKNDLSAYTVFVIGCLTSDNKIQIRDVRRGRWDSNEIIEEVFQIAQQYDPDLFWFEAENIQRSLGPIIEKEMQMRNVYIPIESVVPTKDKVQRARPLQARMRAGGVQFNKEASWYFDYEKELRQFDKGPFKDQVDASALLVFGINQMSAPMEQHEIDEDEYNREFGSVRFGRSPVTGY